MKWLFRFRRTKTQVQDLKEQWELAEKLYQALWRADHADADVSIHVHVKGEEVAGIIARGKNDRVTQWLREYAFERMLKLEEQIHEDVEGRTDQFRPAQNVRFVKK